MGQMPHLMKSEGVVGPGWPSVLAGKDVGVHDMILGRG